MIKEIIDNIQFEYSGHTLVKMRYVGDHEVRDIDSVIIPSEIKGNPIYTIKKGFLNVKKGDLKKIYIKKLIISEGITEIEPSAFGNLNADEVIWASSCKEINELCFEWSSIKTISNIQNVEVVGERAFYECKELKEFIWPENCTSIPIGCFIGCKSIKEFNFNAIKVIKQNAFLNAGLERVLNMFKIKTIEAAAFSNCYSLREFKWPENCSVIPYQCFAYCTNLKEFNFKAIKQIEIGAFLNAGLIRALNTYNIKTIEKYAFYNCSFLEEFNWPESCTIIPRYCFSDCKSLKEFDFKNIKAIKPAAFCGAGLQSVVETSAIQEIGEEAFSLCQDLKEFTWPDNCPIIPNLCFCNCCNLVNISNLKNIERISAFAFTGSYIKAIDLRESLINNQMVYVDDLAFDNIESITILK